MQPIINHETDLVNYLRNETNDFLDDFIWKKYFPKFKLLGFNYFIYGALSYDPIGWVDIAFKYKQTTYFVEVKYVKNNPAGDFWESLKVM